MTSLRVVMEVIVADVDEGTSAWLQSLVDKAGEHGEIAMLKLLDETNETGGA